MIDAHPMQLLKKYSQDFPKAWRQIASFREDRGKSLPWWPDWCYCPIAGAVAVVTDGAPQMGQIEMAKITAHPPAVLAALAGWRISKGIYRFDETLLQEIATMPLDGDLPSDIFYSLPEWCIYVETPGLSYLGDEVAGAFASLEYDVKDHRHELRFVFVDSKLECLPVAVHLGKWSIKTAIERSFKESGKNMEEYGFPGLNDNVMGTVIQQTIRNIMPFINLVLYICSVNADFGEIGRPQHPSRKARRKGKIQAENNPRKWDVGVRIGPALKRASETNSAPPGGKESGGIHASPRGHVRRAHWHHFWTGPRAEPEKRKLILKWLPPVPVGMPDLDEEDLPAVIRRVEKEES